MSKKPIYGIPVGGGGGSCQPDWNQTDDTQNDYIKNKPEIPNSEDLATKEYVENTKNEIMQEVQNTEIAIYTDFGNMGGSELQWIRNNDSNSVPLANNGTWSTISVSSEVESDCLVQRTDSGGILVPDEPGSDNEAVSRVFVISKTSDVLTEAQEYADAVANNPSYSTDLTETTITLMMDSNIEYHCINPIESLAIESFNTGKDGIADQWSIIFTTAATISISYPDTVKWAVAEPVFEGNKIYWLSFIPFDSNYLGVWTVAEAEVTTSES